MSIKTLWADVCRCIIVLVSHQESTQKLEKKKVYLEAKLPSFVFYCENVVLCY